jgi:hypothetical protein
MTNFEDITIRKKISSRGGGIEVDLTDIVGYPVQMTAYQNYLGGGMLGRVASDCNIDNWKENDELVEIADELRKYFHGLTNPSDSDWESQSFEQNQQLPVSAY